MRALAQPQKALVLEWAVFHGQVGEGRGERGGHLRTLVEQLVANVDPPGVFAASVNLPRHVRQCRS